MTKDSSEAPAVEHQPAVVPEESEMPISEEGQFSEEESWNILDGQCLFLFTVHFFFLD